MVAIMIILVVLLVLQPMIGRLLASASSAASLDEGEAALMLPGRGGAPAALMSPQAMAGMTGNMALPGAQGSMGELPPPQEPPQEEVMINVQRVEGRVKASALKKVEDIVQAYPDTCVGIGFKPVSRIGSQRLIGAAIDYALEHQRKSVTLVHKGNIMKYTEGAFRDWGYQLAEENYGDKVYTWAQWERTKKDKGESAANQEQQAALSAGKLLVKDAIADITLQQVLTRPEDFDVIATLNLNGDYLSDALAAQVGGIGIAPGANINYVTGHAIFEATHGTAPKYAGQDKVNPGSVILSGAMMLEHLGWLPAAKLIYSGLEKSIAAKKVTYDFERQMEGATLLKCSEFGDEIIRNM